MSNKAGVLNNLYRKVFSKKGELLPTINQDNNSIKILLFADQDENLSLTHAILKKIPVETIPTTCHIEALMLIEKNDFSIIILHFQFAVKQGFEIAKKIRKIKKMQSVSIIFITENNIKEKYILRAYALGAIDYIFKPFHPDILLAKINAILKLHHNKIMLEKLVYEKENALQEISKINSKLHYLAYHDPLTTIGNRAGFESALAKKLKNTMRDKIKFTLLLIDLDHFKTINDSFGHHYGDLVLQEVAKCIKKVVRKTDHVDRIGGDEFAVILENINSEYEAGYVAKKILHAFSKISQTLTRKINISASIGILCYGSDRKHVNAKAVVRDADIAMFRAKEKRNNTFEFYSKKNKKMPRISPDTNETMGVE